MITKLPYRGWQLVAHHQQGGDPYLPFVCMAWKEEVSTRKLIGFNREGHSIKAAVEACCREIDRKD